jgi:hypothetical protein
MKTKKQITQVLDAMAFDTSFEFLNFINPILMRIADKENEYVFDGVKLRKLLLKQFIKARNIR